MQKLTIDFYESGVGDTIVITFPSGALGVVDAHPSPSASRPAIASLVQGKKFHFICLTHPHEDHGLDLLQIFKMRLQVGTFWHTNTDIQAFAYQLEEIVTFPSPIARVVQSINAEKAKFFFDLYGEAIEQSIPFRCLHSDLQPFSIEGVEFFFLSPDQSIQDEFRKTYFSKTRTPDVEEPDFNLLSAVLAVKFGGKVILLGADALKRNWSSANKHYRKHGLPKAVVLKVPHHGAKNSLDFQNDQNSYLQLCSASPQAESIIFAGDANHPNKEVFKKLRKRTNVRCLGNGIKNRRDPLNLAGIGGVAASTNKVCNGKITVVLDSAGGLSVSGNNCDVACFLPNDADYGSTFPGL